MPVLFDANNTPHVDCGTSRLQFQHEEFTETFYKETALKELRETPENVERGLHELRELLKANPDLDVPYNDNSFLIKFLRMCKYYPQSAYDRICNYYKFKAKFPTEGKDLVPQKVRSVFEKEVVKMYGPRDQLGRRIVLCNLGGSWDTNAVPMLEFSRGLQLAMEAASLEPRTQVAGAVMIVDLKGFGLMQAKAFSPHFVKNLAEWIQDIIPLRLKLVQFVNQPYVFNMVYALFKPFLREKLTSRIHFNGSNREQLHAMVTPSALLPRHSGLMTDEIFGEDFWQLLHYYEDRFRYIDNYGYKKKPKNKD